MLSNCLGDSFEQRLAGRTTTNGLEDNKGLGYIFFPNPSRTAAYAAGDPSAARAGDSVLSLHTCK